ncbi:MAG: biotin synthase BioB [Gemmataceae bacterium]
MKTLQEFRAVYDLPLTDLIFRAATVHRQHHDPQDVQRCVLLSIKTGGCPEDCGYCSQSAHFKTPVEATPLLTVEEVSARARQARDLGASRFCMGAAWRGAKDGPSFDRVLDMVRTVRSLGLEACVTLGMLTDEQAQRLAEAGLTAYNHNLDTSREHYGNVITTRTYDDRLKTIAAVQKAGISVCCGGILGLGESEDDRLRLLTELAALDPPPESIPINTLVPIAGTPLGMAPLVDPLQLVRLVATTRIGFPKARVRLSAGRDRMSREVQLLCILAGANSIFYGDKLLTADNPSADSDAELFRALGLPEPAAAGEPA